MIVIDREQVTDENGNLNITPEVVSALIERNENYRAERELMYSYYKGEHAILKNVPSSSGMPNNRIVCNFAKYAVDMSQGYMFGNAIAYTATAGVDLEPLQVEYDAQGIQGCDSKLFKYAMIFGSAIEIVYSNDAARPRSAVLPPTAAFVVYDDTVEHKRLLGVQYYEQKDITDSRVINTVAIVFTDTERIEFHGINQSFAQLEEIKRESHCFGNVPMIEYELNDEQQSDFKQEIPLIDAYNTLMSERLNDKQQFVDAFIFLKNIEVDTERARKLKKEKILMTFDENGDAKYLAKVLNEADVEVLRKTMREDLHKFSMVPDLTDESFGNNLSGVAIKYKLMGFEQNIKNKERCFCKGLKERIKIYSRFLATLSLMQEIDPSDVTIVINRNLPQNDLETSQMVQNLKNIVSDETLFDQINFIEDSKEELKLIKKQREAEAKRLIDNEKRYLENTGYGKTADEIGADYE